MKEKINNRRMNIIPFYGEMLNEKFSVAVAISLISSVRPAVRQSNRRIGHLRYRKDANSSIGAR